MKIQAKYLKIWTNSLKIRAKIASNVVWLQKMAPNVYRKTHEDLFFWGGHIKKRSLWYLWEKICRQKS